MPRKATKLKEHLIKKGLESLEKEGSENLSLRKIADACGVTHASPYKYFKNKDDFLRALMTEIMAEFGQYLLIDVEKEASVALKLEQLGCNFVQYAVRKPHYFDALFLEKTRIPLTIKNEQLISDEDLPAMTVLQTIMADVTIRSVSNDTVFVHLWSYITGLALLVSRRDIENAENEWIRSNIRQMLAIYFEKGED